MYLNLFFKPLALVILFAFSISGCAYRFGHVKRSIPGGYDRVAVPLFKNNSSETGAETFFTKSMIEEIERAHIAKVVPKEDAQVIIEGVIVSVQYIAGATVGRGEGLLQLPENANLTKEYRVVIDSVLKVRRTSDQKILWEGGVSGERRYPAPLVSSPGLNTVNPLYNQSARTQNVEIVARDMMAEAYTRLTENF